MANRRSVLIGLGGLVAGGGALLGTGAFTTVEAERTVSIQTAGDADAFLGLDVDDDYDAGDDDLVQINLDGDADAEGDGLLLDATTTYEPILVVDNNGTQDVQSLTVEVDEDAAVDGIDMDFELHEDYEFDDEDGFAAESGNSISDLPLGVGESAAFDLSVTTDAEEVSADEDFDITVTITAETEA